MFLTFLIFEDFLMVYNSRYDNLILKIIIIVHHLEAQASLQRFIQQVTI